MQEPDDEVFINRGPAIWDDLGVNGPMEWLKEHPGATNADLAEEWNKEARYGSKKGH